MKRLLPLLLCLTLVACEEAEETPSVDPIIADRAEAACLRDGGAWQERPASGAMICLRTPPDAGQSCETSRDCTTSCLARSRTCAPVEPLFGCNDVIGPSGNVSTLCID